MSGLQTAHASVIGEAFRAGFQNFIDQSAANYQMLNSDIIIVPVAAGFHKVDLYWSVSGGTVTGQNDSRILTVREL